MNYFLCLKLDTLDEVYKFIKKHKLPKLTQKEIEHLIRANSVKILN